MAREYLAQGRFRKARDEFKVLCKADRPRFLPLLIEANLGLAREMLGKGMVAEAQQVVAYLKTIASREQVFALELEVNPGAAASGQANVIAEILGMLARPLPATAEWQRLADRAVLAFEPLANPAPEVAALARELEAIVSALRAVSERQFERALDMVRPVGQSSVFGQWKNFIKGLAAFHGGDREKAGRWFRELAPGGVPAKAGQAYLLLLGGVPLMNNAPLPSEAAVEAAARLAGEPGCGAALLRAEQAWRKPDPVQMYQSLKGGIGRFPREGTDFLGTLSEFALNCSFTLPVNLQTPYWSMAAKITDQGQARGPAEAQMFLRVTVVVNVHVMPDVIVLDYWERFLRLREKLHGRDPALDSLAYGWLGRVMSEPRKGPEFSLFGFSDPGSGMRNAEEARRLLEKAINLDPENLPASLSLCEVYRQQRLISERNRLLDRMTARFPADKNVLLLAGQACLERKTCKRGLDYLHQALAIDRLDPAIPDLLVRGWFLQAREYFQKQRPDEARQAMDQTMPFAVDNPANLVRSRWCLSLQRGLIETFCGDPARAPAFMDEAVRQSPSPAALFYHAGFLAEEIVPRGEGSSPHWANFTRESRRAANAADAVLLTRIWVRGRELVRETARNQALDLLEDYLGRAARRPFAREDACRLLEFCRAENYFAQASLALVKHRLQEDADDPLFRLYKMRLDRWASRPPLEEDRPELEEIIAEATRRKEDQTVRQARHQLEAIGEFQPLPPPGPDQDEDDFEDDFEGPEPAGLPPDLPALEEILEIIGNASPRELKRLRDSRPPGMTVAEFDLLVGLALAGRAMEDAGLAPKNLLPPKFAPPKRVPPRRVPPKPGRPILAPPPDPNQSDLL